jgi:hypothetical protein
VRRRRATDAGARSTAEEGGGCRPVREGTAGEAREIAPATGRGNEEGGRTERECGRRSVGRGGWGLICQVGPDAGS